MKKCFKFAHTFEIHLEKEQKNVIFGLGLIVLIASVPFLCNANLDSVSLHYYMQRIEELKIGLLNFRFFAILNPEWLTPADSSESLAYGNIFLLFPAILRLLGLPSIPSYHLFGIVWNMITAFIAYYCFRSIFKNKYIGLICSGFYTLSIFRIHRFVVLSAVGESCAYTFFPLILYGFFRAFTEDSGQKQYKTVWISIAIGIGGVMQTHFPSFEVTCFLIAAICLLNLRKVTDLPVFWELLKGFCGAVLAGAWSLFPVMRNYLAFSNGRIQSFGLYFAQLALHFWKFGENTAFSGQGMSHSTPCGVGLILVLGVFVFCFLWFGGALKGKGDRLFFWGKLSAVLGIAFMWMSLSAFPWDWIQDRKMISDRLISSLQSPTVFLGWGTFFLIMTFGFCLWYCAQNERKWEYYLLCVCFFIEITTSSMYLTDSIVQNMHQTEDYVQENCSFEMVKMDGTTALEEINASIFSRS